MCRVLLTSAQAFSRKSKQGETLKGSSCRASPLRAKAHKYYFTQFSAKVKKMNSGLGPLSLVLNAPTDLWQFYLCFICFCIKIMQLSLVIGIFKHS